MKKLWFILHFLLLSLSVIAWIAGADNLFGICVTTIIILSFPSNLLVGWLFFAFEAFSALPGMMLLMAFVMSVVGYLQWFEFVPRIAKFFSSRLSAHDLQLELKVTREDPPQIEEGTREGFRNWMRDLPDKEKCSPVERVFSQETD